MYVQPIGTGPSDLSVFWPLWDAALLRRYGRAKPCFCPTTVSVAAAYLALSRNALRRVGVVPPSPAHTAGEPAAELVAGPQPPPELDLHWPSDQPIEPPQIIVVERWLRAEMPAPGGFVDLLY